MNSIPQELNWVEKRAACNIAEVFHQLCLEIGSDIIAINTTKHKDDLFLHFQQDSLQDGSVVIGQPKRTPRVTVMIGIVDQKIMVRNQATQEQDRKSTRLNSSH